MLNHFHFLDSGARRPAAADVLPLRRARAATATRSASPATRIISWASLDFQPEFTATASNIGYGWWSHDIGGHIFGVRDDELATRWVQLGVFSPILRLHSSSNPFLAKEPWTVPAPRRATAMTERAAVPPPARAVPAHDEPPRRGRRRAAGAADVPPSRRDEPRAYDVPNQFAFGSELLVAPITTPRDAVHAARRRAGVAARRARGSTCSPATVYDGDREVELHRDLGSIPVLLRAGGILPLAAEDDLDATRNPERLELLVAPGADGAFTLIEDDGTGATPEDIPAARTTIAWRQAAGVLDDRRRRRPARRAPALSATWTVTFLGADARAVDARRADRSAAARRGRRRPAARARPAAPTRCSRCSTRRSTATRPRRRPGRRSPRTSRRPPSSPSCTRRALPRELIGALSELLTAS